MSTATPSEPIRMTSSTWQRTARELLERAQSLVSELEDYRGNNDRDTQAWMLRAKELLGAFYSDDPASTRCRKATQAIIEVIGASGGPASLEDVVPRITARLAAAEAVAEAAEDFVVEAIQAARRMREIDAPLAARLNELADRIPSKLEALRKVRHAPPTNVPAPDAEARVLAELARHATPRTIREVRYSVLNAHSHTCLIGGVGVVYGDTEDQARANGRFVSACTPDAILRLCEKLEGARAATALPEVESFRDGVVLEAGHQRVRRGEEDATKTPADWFWLVGYLAGKALHANIMGDRDKALHHAISTAAVLANWHAAMLDPRAGAGMKDHGATS